MPERRVPVGWRLTTPDAALAFLPPELITEAGAPAEAAALGSLAARTILFRCPFDLRLEISPPAVRPVRITRDESVPGLTETGFKALVTMIAPSAQRSRTTPAVQISLNTMLITDAPATLILTPPFASTAFRDWPGTLVGGRFPLTNWPRALNAVLEWQDRDRAWSLRRGDPLAYARIDFGDPDAVPELVEAASTPALTRHFAQISNVVAFGRNVGPMFEEAARRRPARLLVPKKTGTPVWE
ncbi:MAG: hypothetical protein ACFBSD_05685 [Paracoccaceae bacterium]